MSEVENESHPLNVQQNAHGYHNTGLEPLLTEDGWQFQHLPDSKDEPEAAWHMFLVIRGKDWEWIEREFASARRGLGQMHEPDWEAVEDDLEQVISDSFDVDWQARTGARAVIEFMKDKPQWWRDFEDRNLRPLLKAAHEVVDGTGETADGSEFYWEVSRECIDNLQAATLPYQDRIDLFTGTDCDCRDGEHVEDCPNLPENVSERLLTRRLERADHVDINPTIPALLHRLSVMAHVADDQSRGGDAFTARDAMRVIGELQSQVTRLTVRGEERPVEEFDPLPLDGQ